MDDSLANPIQSEEIGIHIDLRPRLYYPNEEKSQSIQLDDNILLPILYDGVLSYLPVRRPTPQEIDSCTKFPISSIYDWDPYKIGGNFSQVLSNNGNISSIIEEFESSDPISTELSYITLNSVISSHFDNGLLQYLYDTDGETS